MPTRAPIELSSLEKALVSLEAALTPPPANDRERDGAIQRFEYTFELAWKMGKRVLEANGVQSLSPRNVIRDLAQVGWIQNAELWMDFLNARNAVSHTYRDATAQEVFELAKKFAIPCRALLEVLKDRT